MSSDQIDLPCPSIRNLVYRYTISWKCFGRYWKNKLLHLCTYNIYISSCFHFSNSMAIDQNYTNGIALKVLYQFNLRFWRRMSCFTCTVCFMTIIHVALEQIIHAIISKRYFLPFQFNRMYTLIPFRLWHELLSICTNIYRLWIIITESWKMSSHINCKYSLVHFRLNCML